MQCNAWTTPAPVGRDSLCSCYWERTICANNHGKNWDSVSLPTQVLIQVQLLVILVTYCDHFCVLSNDNIDTIKLCLFYSFFFYYKKGFWILVKYKIIYDLIKLTKKCFWCTIVHFSETPSSPNSQWTFKRNLKETKSVLDLNFT